MHRHHARVVQVIGFLSAVLSAIGCGADSVPLPPSPFVSVRSRSAPPPGLLSENAQRGELLRRLDERTGPGAIDCGTFAPRRRDPEEASRASRLARAFACLQAESLRRRPARLFIRIQGTDTWIAKGLFTKADGAIWAFDYDADPVGDRSPRIRSWPCPDPAPGLEPERASEFGCRGFAEPP